VIKAKAKAAKISRSAAQAVNSSKVQTKAGNKAKRIVIKAANKASKTAAKAGRTSKTATAVDNRTNRIAVKADSKGSKASKTAVKAVRTTRVTVRSGTRKACAALRRLSSRTDLRTIRGQHSPATHIAKVNHRPGRNSLMPTVTLRLLWIVDNPKRRWPFREKGA